MDGGWLARARWRRRGAWLWPMFVVTILADGLLGWWLPLSGQSQHVATGIVLGLCLNVLGVLLLSRPLSMAIRRRRRDLPAVVARNYGGTAVVITIFAALALVGVIHHHTIVVNQRAMRDAVTRAQAWIGDRAPAPFRRNLALVDTFAIQPGSVYRSCVPSLVSGRMRSYCVIVNLSHPFPGGVRFAGSEPNYLFSEGVG